MAHYGWVLFIEKRPDGWKNLPTRKERADVLRKNSEDSFAQVEALFPDGVSFASKQELIGTACIIGPDKECLLLKAEIERLGIGTMTPNDDCLRPA